MTGSLAFEGASDTIYFEAKRVAPRGGWLSASVGGTGFVVRGASAETVLELARAEALRLGLDADRIEAVGLYSGREAWERIFVPK